MTPIIERDLESFMQGAARRITGNQPQRGGGWKMDWPPSEVIHERVEVWRDHKGRHKEAEYGCAVHYNATNSEPMWSGHAEGGGKGVPKVVGSGGNWSEGGEGRAAEALALDFESESEEESEAEGETEPEVQGRREAYPVGWADQVGRSECRLLGMKGHTGGCWESYKLVK